MRLPAASANRIFAPSATSATATSLAWVATHDSLVPSTACIRLAPEIAGQPLPGCRLLHGMATSRKYVHRVRCIRFPPMLAMFRSCWEALSSKAREITGYTPGCRATSLIRSNAPMRSPSLVSMPRNGRSLMSRTRCGVRTLSFIRSTRVVPPARNGPGEARAASTVVGAVSSKGRIGVPRLFDCRDDVRVGRAAADVAGHELPHVLDALPDRGDCRHDLARGAEPALQGVLVEEGLLDRVQTIPVGESFHRCHLLFHGGGQGQAREHGPAADVHGAGAALSSVASLLRTGHPEAFPQGVQQRHTG